MRTHSERTEQARVTPDDPVTSAAPIKIVRVVTRLNIGGPSFHVATLSTGLDAERFATCLVIGQPDAGEGSLEELVREVRTIRVPTLQRPLRFWNDARSLLALLRLLWAERPRLLHTHMAKAGALGRLAGWLYNTVGPGRRRNSRVILIHTFHGHVLEGYFPLWLARMFVTIERWLARRTHGLIAVSPAVRDDLLQKGIGRPAQWHVIPLGLELSPLGRLPPPNGSTPLRLGLVGRLVPIKNPGLFLEALAQVRRRQPDIGVQGMVVGDGPLRAALERQARQGGIAEVVHFTGWQRDVPAVYEQLEAVCLTSWNEGTPVAVIEAMAAGRAVIATDVGGVRDVLDDAGSPQPAPIPSGSFRIASRGLLVRAGDAAGLARAMEALVADPALRRRLGDAARPYALQRFAATRLVQDVTALYEQFLREDQSTCAH